MNFSKMLAAVVLVASLVLAAEAGGHYCRGPHCRRAPPAYLPGEPRYRGAANPHGPYHSYAVRPAVYGGPRLYSYRGYARQPAPVAAIHLKAAAYSPLAHAPLVAPLTLAIETDAHQQHQYAAPLAPARGNGYAANYAPALRPIKAVLLAPVHAIAAAPLEKTTGYLPAKRPAGGYLPAREQKRVALASKLYRDEKRRPAAYGSGHYYQTLDTLRAKRGYGRPAAAAGGAY